MKITVSPHNIGYHSHNSLKHTTPVAVHKGKEKTPPKARTQYSPFSAAPAARSVVTDGADTGFSGGSDMCRPQIFGYRDLPCTTFSRGRTKIIFVLDLYCTHTSSRRADDADTSSPRRPRGRPRCRWCRCSGCSWCVQLFVRFGGTAFARGVCCVRLSLCGSQWL